MSHIFLTILSVKIRIVSINKRKNLINNMNFLKKKENNNFNNKLKYQMKNIQETSNKKI